MGAKPMAFLILRAMDRIHGPFFLGKIKEEAIMGNRKTISIKGRKQ
jgi:hypothetical protein